jgi:molecular chaperone GrpE (heat shock protein)
MTNNFPEEERTDDTPPATAGASGPAPEAGAGEPSVEVAEAAPDVARPQNDEAADNNDGVGHEATALLASLSEQLKETNRISQERESVIDRLHRENQKLKQGELQQAVLPIFRDLIRLYDDLKSTASKYSDRAAADGESVVKDLSLYGETVVDILYRYGVEQIEARAGDDFDSKEHKAVAAAPTAEQGQDRKISRIIRDGFRAEARIIRNVEVEVLRYATPKVEGAARDAANTEEVIEHQPEAQ